MLSMPVDVPTRPYLIGIAGPSCSGKSSLAKALCLALPEPASILTLDSYYLPLDHLPLNERDRCNFDQPDALEWDLIVAHVRQLARGEVANQPVYLFDQHTRASAVRCIQATPFVILEGLLALYDQRVREELHTRIFVNAPDQLCFERRRRRDVAERGRTPASVWQQYNETVRPMAKQFILPTQAYADVVIDGDQPLSVLVPLVLRQINGTARRI
jgi:uridine kinase